jgi:hypothetical protein
MPKKTRDTSRGIQGAAKQAAPEEGAARHCMYQPVGTENWNEQTAAASESIRTSRQHRGGQSDHRTLLAARLRMPKWSLLTKTSGRWGPC